MIQTPTTSPDFELHDLENLPRDEQNRLIAAAAAFIAAGSLRGDEPAESISAMFGVTPRVRDDGAAPAMVRERLYAMLRRIEEPRLRRIAMGLGRTALAHAAAPGPDDMFDSYADRSTRPNLGLAIEAILGALGLGSSSITLFDAEYDIAVKLKPLAKGDYISIAPAGGGRALKRRPHTVVMSILDGSLVLRDPDGRPLIRSDGIGSLHAESPDAAAWRTGNGPAAGLSTDAVLDLLKDHVAGAPGIAAHLPAIVAVSKDGWIQASSLADVPGANDADKFDICLKRAKALAPTFLCLLDSTGGAAGHTLIAYAAPDRNDVVDPRAGHRMADLAGIFPGLGRTEPDDGSEDGSAISVARAQAFARAAARIVR